jgi:hypothetical protein
MLSFPQVDHAVVIGNAAALDVIVVIVGKDEILGWRRFSHRYKSGLVGFIGQSCFCVHS